VHGFIHSFTYSFIHSLKMLTDLKIKNYALIEQLEMNPSPLLNIITGETGAGKSIMLGAIGLLLGNRADTRMLFSSEEKCVVEGIFNIAAYQLQEVFTAEDLDYDPSCILRREISPSGKSRAFINDTPVTLDTLRRIGTYLMDIHSQHDTLLLGDPAFQLTILDLYAATHSLKEGYGTAYRGFKKLETAYRSLEQQLAQSQKELDYHTFLLNELEEAKLQEGEQEGLEEELRQLEHAEEIKLKLSQVLQYLSESEFNAVSALKDSCLLLGQLSAYADTYKGLHERLESCRIELVDIAAEVETAERITEADPRRVDEINDRLSILYNLQRKHQVRDTAGLLEIQRDLQAAVGKVVDLDAAMERTRTQMEQAQAQVQQLAAKLSQSRQQVFVPFTAELQALLADLGMPNARTVIEHKQVQPIATGTDEISILFSANKGAAPQTLSKAASGGEFSRLMLCIKYLLADKTALPTIVFDEIDTGISGEIGVKVGRMMQQMAQKHQLIAISHLPQMAAQGHAHYYVYKEDRAERTISRIKKLSNEERISEIAQMIAGANPSVSAYESAKELLAL
jgi:DNA repair protein RecN (Recombination protein N)